MSLPLLYLLGSALLDILANLALTLSEGFKKKAWEVLSISGTALATWWFLDQPMNRTIVFGIGILILAIVLMQID